MTGIRRVATLLAVVMGSAWPAGEAGAQTQKPHVSETTMPARPERITVTVTGLSCPFCAYGLEKRYQKLAGVDSMSIQLKTGTVVLFVRDGSQTSDKRIRKLTKDGGFEATKIERAPLASAS